MHRNWAIVALVLSATAVMSMAGCSQQQFKWSSERGRECFYDCQRGRYQCNASCYYDPFCRSSCSDDEATCMSSCPDVSRVEQPRRGKPDFAKPRVYNDPTVK